MRKRAWLLALLILVLLAVIYGFTLSKPAAQKSGRGFDPERVVPVRVTAAEQQDMEIYLDALGTVTSRNSVVVKSRVEGEILKLHFTEGQMVKVGDLLAEIDPRPFQAQLAQAQGQLLRDQALLDNALIDVTRYQTLWEQDSISKQQLDTQEALVRQYRGAVAVDKALIDTASLQLSYCRITAPISGRVGLRQIDAGNMIAANDAGGIVTITQLQPITVLFSIPEDQLPVVSARIRQDKTTLVEAYDRGGKLKLARGSLLTTDNQIDPTTGTIRLRALFHNQNSTLFPNQFVNVRMLVAVRKGITVVPVSAVQRGRSGNYVYVVEQDMARLRNIRTDKVSGELIGIIDGVEPGELVVTDGADTLRDGSRVAASMRFKRDSELQTDEQGDAVPVSEPGRPADIRHYRQQEGADPQRGKA